MNTLRPALHKNLSEPNLRNLCNLWIILLVLSALAGGAPAAAAGHNPIASAQLELCPKATTPSWNHSAAESLPEIPPDPGVFMLEGSGAVLGGAACAAGLGFLLTRIYDPSADVWKTFGGTVLGGSLGYPVFCGVGCWAAGGLVRQHGRLSGAVVGALAATPVGLTLAWIGTLVEHLPPGSIKSSPIYVFAALIPPTGAVIGYNLSRPAGPAERQSRLGLPELRFGTTADACGTPCPVVDLRAITVGF